VCSLSLLFVHFFIFSFFFLFLHSDSLYYCFTYFLRNGSMRNLQWSQRMSGM
jgi:hypothetical protein